MWKAVEKQENVGVAGELCSSPVTGAAAFAELQNKTLVQTLSVEITQDLFDANNRLPRKHDSLWINYSYS